MASSRIDALRRFIETSPDDPFPRYGLAMELKTQNRLDESHAAFEEMERRFPEYVPQYLMHLQVLVTLGRKDEARALGERGLDAARRKGDAHAQNEIRDALEALDAGD